MAARKVSNAAAAAAFAVAVVAMLVVAAAADDCGVDSRQVMSACLSYCRNRSMQNQCCNALKRGNTKCLCDSYWGQLQKTQYASCARELESKCGIGC